MSTSKLQIGTHVIAVTTDRVAVNALIEVVHVGLKPESLKAYQEGSLTHEEMNSKYVEHYQSAEEHKAVYGQWPCVNLIFLQADPKMTDQYGRQKGHMSSCSHGNVQGVPQGYCWFFPEEVPNVEIGQVIYFDKPVSE